MKRKPLQWIAELITGKETAEDRGEIDQEETKEVKKMSDETPTPESNEDNKEE